MRENENNAPVEQTPPAAPQTAPQAPEAAPQASTHEEVPQAPQEPQQAPQAAPEGVGSLLGDAMAKAEQAEQPEQPAPGQEAAPEQEPEGVPEEYSDVQINENFSIHPGALDGLKAAAKDAGLTQKQFDTLCKGYGEAHVAISQDLMRQARTQWEAQVKADPEIGGANLDKALVYAGKALNKFASKELKDYLNTSGLGSSPEMVRLFYRIGKAVSQDTPVVGGASAPTTRRRYPNSEMVADIF